MLFFARTVLVGNEQYTFRVQFQFHICSEWASNRAHAVTASAGATETKAHTETEVESEIQSEIEL